MATATKAKPVRKPVARKPRAKTASTPKTTTTRRRVTRNKAAVSGIVTQLENCLAAIARKWPTVSKDIAVVVASKGKRAVRGYHAPQRWELGRNIQAAELLIAAEFLDSGARRIFTTLLHECVHSRAYNEGVSDTSQEGRYHNGEFAKLAREMGLVAERDPGVGFATPDVTNETAKLFAKEIAALNKATKMHRHGENDMPKRRNKNLPRAYCGCEENNKIAASQMRVAKGCICVECGELFEVRV